MKKNTRVLAILVAGLLALQANAFAKTVEGTVASVDAAAKKVNLNVTDESGAAKEVSIAVTDTTQYSGVQNLDALTEGAKVTIEADEDAAGGWTATSVALPEASAPVAQ